jgi:TolB-like protein
LYHNLLQSQESSIVPQSQTIAVLRFTNNTDVFAYDRLELSIPEMLKTELSQYEQLVVVEREDIEKIIAEQALSLSGAIDETSAQEVGRLLGAEYILKGELSLINSAQLRIDCHIISVKTGQIKGEKIVGPRNKSLEKMVQLLAGNILFNLTGESNFKSSAKIQGYPTGWFLVGTILTAAAGGFAHFTSEKAYDSYRNATRLDDFDRHFNRANDFQKIRNGFIAASAAFAITTTILWIAERDGGNKIYAQTYAKKPPQTLWAVNLEQGVSLNFIINF